MNEIQLICIRVTYKDITDPTGIVFLKFVQNFIIRKIKLN